MMPLIDNVLLVKSVQTLNRLGAYSRIKGVFCNVSSSTLLDPEFFPELVEFMEENSGLSESLIFEVGQSAIAGLGTTEFGALDTLGALGYGFSLDHVADFELDFAASATVPSASSKSTRGPSCTTNRRRAAASRPPT